MDSGGGSRMEAKGGKKGEEVDQSDVDEWAP